MNNEEIFDMFKSKLIDNIDNDAMLERIIREIIAYGFDKGAIHAKESILKNIKPKSSDSHETVFRYG